MAVIALIQDSYGGRYSGGSWLAIFDAAEIVGGRSTRAQYCLIGDAGPSNSASAAEFWRSPPDWIAVGNSPDEAVEALGDKLSSLASGDSPIVIHQFARKAPSS